MLYEKDDRVKANTTAKNTAIKNVNNVYNQIQADNQAISDKNNQYLDQYLQTNTDLANRQTEFDINLINQQKQEAEKGYQDTARGINTNYQKAINPYGVEAEKKAMNNLNNTGYTEAQNLNQFTQTQKQIASARQTLDTAVTTFNNQISEARNKNDSTIAQFGLDVMKQRLEAQLEEFKYSSELKLNQLSTVQGLDNDYYSRYSDIVNQINWEKEQAESKRQYNEQLSYQKSQDKISNDLDKKYYELQKKYS